MNIEQKLFEDAKSLIKERYPNGWGGAAAMYSKNGNTYTHSICVVRDDEYSNFKILTPCGTCQERLLYWGNKIKVGVTSDNRQLQYKILNDLQPYHWTKAYDDIDFSE